MPEIKSSNDVVKVLIFLNNSCVTVSVIGRKIFWISCFEKGILSRGVANYKFYFLYVLS